MPAMATISPARLRVDGDAREALEDVELLDGAL
jgi:hypothetical protein